MEALLLHLVSKVSYRLVAACLALVPVTHLIGIHLHLNPKQGPGRYCYLLFPFRGGNRHIVLQLLSWVLWSFALLTILPVSLAMLPFRTSLELPTIPYTPQAVDVVSGAAAVVSLIAELFMVSAVIVYESRPGRTPAPPAARLKPHPVLASAVVVVIGLLLSLTGAALLMALEFMPDIPSRVLYCCLSLSCLLIASSTTYGLGGHLRYANGAGVGARGGSSDPGVGGMWQFFQPFSGGTAFVTTQAVGWTLFAGTVVLVVALMQQLVAGVAHCVRCWALGAGTLMMAVQVSLALSLLFFRGRKGAAVQLMRAASGALAISSSGGQQQQCWRDTMLPVLLMYAPVHFFFTLWTLAFVFLPLKVAVAAWLGFLVPYYSLTTRGNPAHTGCRQWAWLMGWFQRNVEGSLTAWFGSLTVVYDGDPSDPLAAAAAAADATAADTAAADAAAHTTDAPSGLSGAAGVGQQEQQGAGQQGPRAAEGSDGRGQEHIFGFQPHALYPTGAGFLPWMPSFRRHFPECITLTASIIFLPPFIRDICCWAGFRQVSKPTFLSALDERGAVMFCPGGQAEMVHAWKAFLPPEQREVVLHTRHKGFCRIAIERQAALVPVLALGENLQLRNLFNLPTLQQLTYRRLGFPVPFILCGRYGVTPFPRRVPLLYVIGKPLQPPPLAAPGAAVDAAAVDALHGRYYASLVDLFERYKRLNPEFREARIVLTDE